MAYTRGPWVVFFCDGISEVEPAMRPGSIAKGIENEDDASLIAAAPDLLEALHAVLLASDNMKVREQAYAAITKATGRNSNESSEEIEKTAPAV